MEKSVAEWQIRFRGMCAEGIMRAWTTKAGKKSSWTLEANFHFAVAERMRLLGNMSIDLDTEDRVKLIHQAAEIIDQLQNHLSIEPNRLTEFGRIVEESNAYYEKFGSKTARHYMYEQGIIDRFGNRREFK